MLQKALLVWQQPICKAVFLVLGCAKNVLSRIVKIPSKSGDVCDRVGVYREFFNFPTATAPPPFTFIFDVGLCFGLRSENFIETAVAAGSTLGRIKPDDDKYFRCNTTFGPISQNSIKKGLYRRYFRLQRNLGCFFSPIKCFCLHVLFSLSCIIDMSRSILHSFCVCSFQRFHHAKPLTHHK